MKKYIVILLLTIKAMNDLNAQIDTVSAYTIKHRWEFSMDYRNRTFFNLGERALNAHGIGLNFGYAPISNKHFFINFNIAGNGYDQDLRRNIQFVDIKGESFRADRLISSGVLEFKLNSFYGFTLSKNEDLLLMVLGPTFGTGLDVFVNEYKIYIPNYYNYGIDGTASKSLFRREFKPNYTWNFSAGAKLRCYPLWERFFIDLEAGLGFGTMAKTIHQGLEGISTQDPIVLRSSNHPNGFVETVGYFVEGSPVTLYFKIGLGFNFFYFKPKDVVKNKS